MFFSKNTIQSCMDLEGAGGGEVGVGGEGGEKICMRREEKVLIKIKGI